jgi:pimeloyl-ACP methyl ester carboxylesterase
MKAARILLILVSLGISGTGVAWAELPADTEVVTGEAVGSLYALYVPASWNGDLVLYAHGYVFPGSPIDLPYAIDGLRDLLVEDGYAFAYSSYSATGWAVREGFKATEHLLPLFRSNFGPPQEVYVIGHSMGGLIAVMLAEKHHGKYDGVLPVCGAIGGGVMAVDYVTEVRVLFDAYYPDVLRGGALEIPEDLDLTFDVIYPALGALYTDFEPAMEMSFVEGLGLEWNGVGELIDATVTGLIFNAAATQDLIDRCGGVFFDNQAWYTHPEDPFLGYLILDEATLNSEVARYEMDRNCRAYLENWYEPTGRLRIPVLTLHDSRDPVVPIKHEWEYAARVESRGSGHLLVQRTVDSYGHCVAFSAQDIKDAFDELAEWVENGVKPAP